MYGQVQNLSNIISFMNINLVYIIIYGYTHRLQHSEVSGILFS